MKEVKKETGYVPPAADVRFIANYIVQHDYHRGVQTEVAYYVWMAPQNPPNTQGARSAVPLVAGARWIPVVDVLAMPEKAFKGCRQRLSNLFLQFIETPEFNPETLRFQKVPRQLYQQSAVQPLSTVPIKGIASA